jgi:hypothetical protein
VNIHHYQGDLASFNRVVAQAPSENKYAAFAMVCRECIRWHTVGGVEKADVIDTLREIGLEADLDEDSIQVALSEAVDHPFDPERRS